MTERTPPDPVRCRTRRERDPTGDLSTGRVHEHQLCFGELMQRRVEVQPEIVGPGLEYPAFRRHPGLRQGVQRPPVQLLDRPGKRRAFDQQAVGRQAGGLHGSFHLRLILYSDRGVSADMSNCSCVVRPGSEHGAEV